MKILLLSTFLLTVTYCCEARKTATATDSVQIKNTVIQFYKWYKANWKQLAAFKLYKSRQHKEGPPYMINWKEVETYFSYLRHHVPYLGEAFIASERRAFKAIDAAFIKYPEDDVPAGFDYDRFTDTQQDPKWFWQELNKKANTWTITISGNKATVVVKGKNDQDKAAEDTDVFCGSVAKEKGTWKMATLACEATVLETNQTP